MTDQPKVVADISDRRLVGRKVRVELEGADGADFSAIKIIGWVVAQYDNEGQTTVIRVSVSGPILCT